MDQTIVNVALATIGRQFHTSATAVARTVIGYQVSVALFIPAAGWLGDRIGPRRLLLGSIAIVARHRPTRPLRPCSLEPAPRPPAQTDPGVGYPVTA